MGGETDKTLGDNILRNHTPVFHLGIFVGGEGDHDAVLHFYKLQSRGVARNSYTEARAFIKICDHIAQKTCHLGGSRGMPFRKYFLEL